MVIEFSPIFLPRRTLHQPHDHSLNQSRRTRPLEVCADSWWRRPTRSMPTSGGFWSFGRKPRAAQTALSTTVQRTATRSTVDWLSGIQNNRGVGQFASSIPGVESCGSCDHPISRRPFLIMKSPAFIKIFEPRNLKSDRCKYGCQRYVRIQNMMII